MLYYTGIQAYFVGFKPARYLLLAQALVAGSLTFLIMRKLGIDFYNNAYPVYSLNAAFVLDVVILSYALGEKLKGLMDTTLLTQHRLLKQLRKKHQAQDQLVEQMRENQELKDRLNTEQEALVAQRTTELRRQNDTVAAQNRELLEANGLLALQSAAIDQLNGELSRDLHAEAARMEAREVDFGEFSQIYPDKDACLRYLAGLPGKWGYDLGGGGWGNNELQAYNSSNNNAFVSGGNLTIVARREQSGNNAYTSAQLLTKSKQTFVFGRTDIRTKVPKGKGIWPAIWMLGADIEQNNWPKCGEIDFMELRGSRPSELLSTMHFGSSTCVLKGITAVQPNDLSADFHFYSAVRSKDQIRFYIDGVQYSTFTCSDVGTNPYPFNNPFFMILNVAVGGDFDGNPTAAPHSPSKCWWTT